jgi:hypothetical protein
MNARITCVLGFFAVTFIGCGSIVNQSHDRSDRGSSPTADTRARDLIPYIEAQQKACVRESTGIYAYQCFTDVDLDRFKADSVLLQIARNARRSQRFSNIVARLKSLPEEERNTILAKARGICHPTWAQLGRITTDGSGQTKAGHAAELLIAGALVRTADEMIAQ